MNGKEKRKKNRNIFLRNQAHNVSPNNAETNEAPTNSRQQQQETSPTFPYIYTIRIKRINRIALTTQVI